MIALGVDPGTRHLGWGVVSREGNRIQHIDHGVIDLDGEASLAARLCDLEIRLSEVIARYKPGAASVESLFFHKDPQAAAKLGHARGVVLLCLARAGIDITEFAPARIKQTIAGHGRADKQQMVAIVRAVLGLEAPPRSDAADALAIAVTYLRIGPVNTALQARRSSHPGAADNPQLKRLLAASSRRGTRGTI